MAWVVAIFVLGGLAGAAGDGFSTFGDFDSEATRGFDLLEQGFSGNAGKTPGTSCSWPTPASTTRRWGIESYLADVGTRSMTCR